MAVVAIVAAVSISAAGAQPSPRATAAKASSATLVTQLAAARVATAKYVSNLNLAKENGYGIITQMIPNMGYHYMNVKIAGFNIKKPPILVYEHTAGGYQLGALEVGVHVEAGYSAASRREVRLVRGRLSLQGRDLRPGRRRAHARRRARRRVPRSTSGMRS
jgi:hypothetical protein